MKVSAEEIQKVKHMLEQMSDTVTLAYGESVNCSACFNSCSGSCGYNCNAVCRSTSN